MHGKNLKEETMLRDLKPTALLHTGQNIKQPEIPLTKAVIEDAISASAYPTYYYEQLCDKVSYIKDFSLSVNLATRIG